MSRSHQVSLANFEEEVLHSQVPVVVDFYADWCAPCRAMGPILDRVSTAFEGQAKIVKVNIDRDPQLASNFNVSSIPTFTFFVKGEVVGQASGMASEADLTDVVQQMIALK